MRTSHSKISRPWKVESLGFVCSPSFFSLPAASRFPRVGWFSRALAFRLLYYPWGKMGTTGSLFIVNNFNKAYTADWKKRKWEDYIARTPYRLWQREVAWFLKCTKTIEKTSEQNRRNLFGCGFNLRSPTSPQCAITFISIKIVLIYFFFLSFPRLLFLTEL